MSNIADLIDIRGEDVEVHRRSSSGVDEFNRPKYTWSLLATEKAVVQVQTWKKGEAVLEAGELTIDDRVGFFKADSVVQEDDHVVHNGVRYDVKSVQEKRVRDSTQFKVAVLKRMVE